MLNLPYRLQVYNKMNIQKRRKLSPSEATKIQSDDRTKGSFTQPPLMRT